MQYSEKISSEIGEQRKSGPQERQQIITLRIILQGKLTPAKCAESCVIQMAESDHRGDSYEGEGNDCGKVFAE
jgi:hypothetical protein